VLLPECVDDVAWSISFVEHDSGGFALAEIDIKE
jgi:hypothetical protein